MKTKTGVAGQGAAAKGRAKRRTFTAEYKAEVVRMCREQNRSAGSVAQELGLTPSAVKTWVLQSEVDARGGGQGPLTSAERDELRRLRRENRELRKEREILKRATAFFVREGTS